MCFTTTIPNGLARAVLFNINQIMTSAFSKLSSWSMSLRGKSVFTAAYETSDDWAIPASCLILSLTLSQHTGPPKASEAHHPYTDL